MNPQNLVPSLETCQRLTEAGVVIDSYFVWYVPSGMLRICPKVISKDAEINDNAPISNEIPAPTASEMLALMPRRLVVENKNNYTLEIYLDENNYLVSYQSRIAPAYWSCVCNTLEQALAETLIWLKGQGYLN